MRARSGSDLRFAKKNGRCRPLFTEVACFCDFQAVLWQRLEVSVDIERTLVEKERDANHCALFGMANVRASEGLVLASGRSLGE